MMIEFIVEGEQGNLDRFLSELREEGIDFKIVRESAWHTTPKSI